MKSVQMIACASFAVATTLAPIAPAHAFDAGSFVGGMAGGVIGGAIAGSIAANAQPRPVYVIQQRRVVQVRRAAPPRRVVARNPAGNGPERKAVINASADPFATSKPAAGAMEPIPVSSKQ